MTDEDFDTQDLARRMDGAVTALKQEFAGLRTGRASGQLLEGVMVKAYGQDTPLNQVGSVSVPESRMISVQIWDKSVVDAADKAIRQAGLGLNPIMDGQNLRIPIPPLSEERRAELAKMAGRYAEQARVAVRNVRRDGMEALKKLEKDNVISSDEHKAHADDVQSMTDARIEAIDAALKHKEEEIMTV